MRYAKVVVGLPVEGPFDYLVPAALEKKVKPGCRVLVPWRTQRKTGYVVALAKTTGIRYVKPILSLIDRYPLLDKTILSLTKKLSDYYCCSWGEAIETALPENLRKGRAVSIDAQTGSAAIKEKNRSPRAEALLIHDMQENKRWAMYLSYLQEAVRQNKSAIVLLPEKEALSKAKEVISSSVACRISVLCRQRAGESSEWDKILSGKVDVVIGNRSAIFAPLKNLGLVIIDREEDFAYKQDQVPHYHPREVALMRIALQPARLILGSTCPSLESVYLARKSRCKYLTIEREKAFPEIKLVDLRRIPLAERKRNIILSRFLQDAVASSLSSREKVLLFLNRRGFATSAHCISCGASLTCPRCSINLVYHFKESMLACHYCNFKMPLPQICPYCNAGYIRYSGAGTEKIESELSRIFPQARIKIIDKGPRENNDGDIFISTQAVMKDTTHMFDCIGVLDIDNALQRVDFRAAEKAFHILSGLLQLTDKRMIIQTGVIGHHLFAALLAHDIGIFYDREFVQRKQLNFPPYRHIGAVKIRGRDAERVKETADGLFRRLTAAKRDKGIKIIAVHPGQPAKLRGNFYWQILLCGSSAFALTRFLKMHLKDCPHSGIIVTVDIDPL